jgi:hypothetical protein
MSILMLASSASPMRNLLDQLVAAAPKAMLLLAVLLGGLIATSLLRRLARWATAKSGLEALAERAGIAKVLYSLHYPHGIAHLVGQVVWIVGLLITFAAIAELLGLPAIAAATSALVAFFPRMVASIAVLIGGFVIADLLRRLISRRKGEGLDSPRKLAALVYYLVLTITVTLAVQQVGLETELVNALLIAVTAATALGATAVFVLGAHRAFREMVALFYLRRAINPGDTIVIDDDPMIVLRFLTVSVLLKGSQGEVLIPASRLLENPLHLQRVTAAPPAGDDVKAHKP